MRQYLSKIPRSTEELLKWYEKYISPLSLLVGFTIDNIVLKRVDLFWGNMLLFGYLAAAAGGIVLYHLIQSGRLRGKFFLWLLPFTTIVIQFGFGGLFSGFVILYSHSAAYATSWIFVLILAVLMIGNERFRARYSSFVFQSTILFVALTSFMLFFLPVIFGRIGTSMFVLSQVVSVAVIVGFVYLFRYVAPEVLRGTQLTLLKSAASIVLIFNVLYFTNAIPPLPLALKDAAVVHRVERIGTEFRLTREPQTWYQKHLWFDEVYHRTRGEPVYVYTAVFAPTRLSTTILHEWEYFDDQSNSWVQSGTFGFQITGGRDGGYRGYSLKEQTEEGKWRVNVKTGSGQLIGRISFDVEQVDTKATTQVEKR